MTRFITVDGESTTEGDQHTYVLLANSKGEEVYSPFGLSCKQCLDFLIQSARQADFCVGYAFNYDITMILKDAIPTEEYPRLRDHGLKVKLDGKNYHLRYIPGKFFSIRRGQERSVKIFDSFGFFQSSFVNALKDWHIGTELEIAELSSMKAQRSAFDADSIEEIRAYNQMECALLVELMNALEASTLPLNIALSKWHGAGAIADAILDKHGVKNAKQTFDRATFETMDPVLSSAYYGGRIQVLQLGAFDESYTYDIRSAYPSICRDLTSEQGTWTHVTGQRSYNPSAIGIWHVTWKLPQGAIIPPFPWRRHDTSILYCMQGEGWYWNQEVMVAIEAYGKAVKIVEGWIFEPLFDYWKPFSWVNDYYQQRAVYKAEHNPAEKAIKLGLNSLYGKTAQQAEQFVPPFHSLFWAGQITSGTRAQLFRAAMQRPEAVIAFATDSIVSTEQLHLPLSTELGDWEASGPAPFFIIQPGLYTNGGVIKTRGVHKTELDWEIAHEIWNRDKYWGHIEIPIRRFIGYGAALQLAKPDWVGTWRDFNKVIAFRPSFGAPAPVGDDFLPLPHQVGLNHRWLSEPVGKGIGTYHQSMSAPYRPKHELREGDSAYAHFIAHLIREAQVEDIA